MLEVELNYAENVAGMGSDLPAEGLKPLPASWFGDGVVS
jgi:hypothetical protein